MDKYLNQIICGDCLQVMREMPDNSIDSIVTDPPYGLSDKRSSERIFDIFQRSFNIVFPNFNEFNIKRTKYSDLVRVSLQGSDLSRAEVMSVIKPFVCMPEGSVDLNSCSAVRNKEIKTGRISPSSTISDSELMDESNTERLKYIGNYILDFGNSLDFSSGNVCSGNIGEFGFGFFTMPISSILTTLAPCSATQSDSSLFRDGVNDIIGVDNDSLSQSLDTPFILASGGAENGLVLRFNLTDTPGKLSATISTVESNAVSQFICPQLIRTSAATSSLTAKLEPCTVSFIASSANGTDSIYYFHVYIPPNLFTLLHKSFDNASGFMGKKWDYDVPSVEQWREALRVLKPGGHVLSFGGTRTYHRMVVNIEDAGFEIRDQILWIYGSGFPKSLDVSKAIDKAAGEYVPGDVLPSSRATGKSVSGIATAFRLKTAANPQSDLSRQWQGWGTALKPAVEPICLARKPLEGTVANNVLKWGTGGMNIDECRIEGEDAKGGEYTVKRFNPGASVNKSGNWKQDVDFIGHQKPGRYPANVILDEEAGKLLDQQSGEDKTHGGRSGIQSLGLYGKFGGEYKDIGDSGGASRFFYCAKASPSERGDFNDHPTVKPIDLIRYLIRLITPPDGIVLDMFGGSGTTALAAIKEGMKYILVERDAHGVDIAEERIKQATRQERMF